VWVMGGLVERLDFWLGELCAWGFYLVFFPHRGLCFFFYWVLGLFFVFFGGWLSGLFGYRLIFGDFWRASGGAVGGSASAGMWVWGICAGCGWCVFFWLWLFWFFFFGRF